MAIIGSPIVVGGGGGGSIIDALAIAENNGKVIIIDEGTFAAADIEDLITNGDEVQY